MKYGINAYSFPIMDILVEIDRLERRLAFAKIPLALALRGAGLNRSTWDRWKAAKTSPRLSNWNALASEIDRLLALSAPKTPFFDSTADHASQSDQHPTPGTARSLEPGEAGALSAPAPGDVSEPSLQYPSEVRA
ncbi:hypothetical protein ACE10X_13095 [Bradyrhizobium sp. Pha-3]|uniref:hypothetical protein n=1 Tax=Bradyrhizobium sp. Pha-3 TaxID=208375 RepID=UPI0035D4237B